MSRLPISRSADLKRLQDEGYDIEIRHAYLLVKGVPYVDAHRQVQRGTIVSTLDLAGDVTTRPSTHVVYFVGEQPCHHDGREIVQIKHGMNRQSLGPGLTVDRSFSNKPPGGYPDYYEKMTRYAAILSGPAEGIEPGATARTYPVVVPEEQDSPFAYLDTASSRAGIGALSARLALGKVAIIGLGGTGTYVFDLVAKTPVREIHLYDGDRFYSHNAFRAPGAPTADQLRAKPFKVDHFAEVYSAMHTGIVAHPVFVDDENAGELADVDFVFLCLDKGSAKAEIVPHLETAGVPFIDVGMGVTLDDDVLGALVRVTASTGDQRDHLRGRVSFGDGDEDAAYAQNIQIADLNALNASLAVIKWKKLLGFYRDLEREHHAVYTLDGNCLDNDDHGTD